MAKRKRRSLPKVIARTDADKVKLAANVRCPTGLRNRAAMEGMHKCGLRVGELVALKVSDIKWREAEPYIAVVRGKGSKDRNVPVGPETLDWLRRWKQTRPKGGPFFNTLAGKPLSTRYLHAMVGRMSRRVGVEGVSPHVFRHCFACELHEEGVPLVEIQALLGHANLATTAVYLHVRGGAAAKHIRSRENGDADPSVDDLARQLKALPAETRKALAAALQG